MKVNFVGSCGYFEVRGDLNPLNFNVWDLMLDRGGMIGV